MQIKLELMKRNKTQEWLISELKKKLPLKYIDSSNLYKIMTGSLKSQDICNAINEVLDIKTAD